MRVSDNWLVIASCVTNSAYCWNGTAWVVLGTALLSLSRRPLLLTDARWEECLHHKVNIRLESGYRLAERRSLYAWLWSSDTMGGIHPPMVDVGKTKSLPELAPWHLFTEI